MRNTHIYKEIRGFITEIFESLSVRHIPIVLDYIQIRTELLSHKNIMFFIFMFLLDLLRSLMYSFTVWY